MYRAALFMLLCSACATGSATIPTPDPARDLAAARDLFDRNIKAIQDRDRDAYLACYRDTEDLVRAGPEGVKLGYAELAASTPTVADAWPERLDAKDVQVHAIRPGVVYGAYAYEVVIDGVTSRGISERVFVLDGDRWRIAVSTAFASPPAAEKK